MTARKVVPNFSSPVTILGIDITIAIPTIDDNKKEGAALVVCHTKFDDDGLKVVFSDKSRKIIRELGGDIWTHFLFRLLSGITKAAYNMACKIARERWSLSNLH